MTIRVSRKDKQFLLHLRNVVEAHQRALPSATRVVGRTPDKTAMDREFAAAARRWDIDGSVVIGRVDTAERSIYVGTQRVYTADDGILVEAHDADSVRALWHEATPESPGDVLLKRELRVEGWRIVAQDTVINRRGQADLRPKSDEVARLRPRVADARTAQMDVAADLQAAVEDVRAGRRIGADMIDPGAWNAILDALAADAGLDDAADLDAIEAVVDAAEGAVNDRRRRELADLVAEIDALIARFPGAADVLLPARDELAADLDTTR